MSIINGIFDFTDYDVTCETAGCQNEARVIRVLALSDDPHVLCGPCGSTITNVAAVAD